MHRAFPPSSAGLGVGYVALSQVIVQRFLCATALATGVILTALPAWSEQSDPTLTPPLTAEEFDARTRGKTIEYTSGGQAYGIEEYRPGHKVVWAFEGGDCREGDWFQHDDQICFDYHDDTPLQCWTFHDTPSGLMAVFQGETESEPLISLKESQTPLNCPGPDLGV